MKTVIYFPLLVLALILANCGSASHEEQPQEGDSTAVEAPEALNDTTKFKFDFAIANIPYQVWLKWFVKLLLIFFVAAMLLLVFSLYYFKVV